MSSLSRLRTGLMLLLLGASCSPDEQPSDASSTSKVRTAVFGEDGTTIAYEVDGELAIYEGDIILGTLAEIEEGASSISVGDRVTTQGSGLHALRDEVGFPWSRFADSRWETSTIPYLVDGDGSYSMTERSTVQATAQAVAQVFSQRTAIRLVPRSDEADYIRIRNYVDPETGLGACGSSQIGRQGGEQILRFRPSGSVSCLLHEFVHALGVPHEQSRPDAPGFVRIQWDNIQDDKTHNFQRSDGRFFETFGPYDYESLMHYGADAFIKEGLTCDSTDFSGCTLLPVDGNVTPQRLGQSSTLTRLDAEGLCDVYGDDGGELSIEWVNADRVEEGRPTYEATVPTLRVEYVKGGARDPIDLSIRSERRGLIARIDDWNQSDDGARFPIDELGVGDDLVEVVVTSGCPKTASAAVRRAMGRGGRVVLDRGRISESEQAFATVELPVAPDEASNDLAIWFVRREGELTERSFAMGRLDSGRRVTGFCDGRYEVGVRIPSGNLAGSAIETATLVIEDEPIFVPDACEPSVTIVRPSDGASVPVGRDIVIEAEFDDDQPQTDEPIHPFQWIVNSVGLPDTGPRIDYRPTSAGPLNITVFYGTAGDSVRLTAVEGVEPEVLITEPQPGTYFRFGTDVVVEGSLFVLDVPGAAQVNHPNETVSDADILWSISCSRGSTGGPAGTGRSTRLSLPVFHDGDDDCTVRVRARTPSGFEGQASVDIRIEGGR